MDVLRKIGRRLEVELMDARIDTVLRMLEGGKGKPKIDHDLIVETAMGRFEGYRPDPLPPLYHIALRWGIYVQYVPSVSVSEGRYTRCRCRGIFKKHLSTGVREIILGARHPRIFYHELAHAAHDKIGLRDYCSRWEAEIVAEMTAAVLGYLLDGRVYDHSLRYLQHWAWRSEIMNDADEMASSMADDAAAAVAHMKEHVLGCLLEIWHSRKSNTRERRKR